MHLTAFRPNVVFASNAPFPPQTYRFLSWSSLQCQTGWPRGFDRCLLNRAMGSSRSSPGPNPPFIPTQGIGQDLSDSAGKARGRGHRTATAREGSVTVRGGCARGVWRHRSQAEFAIQRVARQLSMLRSSNPPAPTGHFTIPRQFRNGSLAQCNLGMHRHAIDNVSGLRSSPATRSDRRRATYICGNRTHRLN
jgi:hypothetical protein